MPSTYKVWMHIEEIDEDGDPAEDEPAFPKQLGEYDTLPAAREAIDEAMSNPATEPRPSEPEVSKGNHTPGPWTIPGSGNLIGTENPRQLIAETHGPDSAANARLIAAAPALLASLERLYSSTYGKTDLVCPLDFEHARKAIAQAKGIQS